MNEHMIGELASVSANHVVAVRILSDGNGYIVQALTTDWTITLDSIVQFSEAVDLKDKYTKLLRHR